MKYLASVCFILLCLGKISGQTIHLNNQRKIVFVCPPCGCDGDTVFYDKPGFCASCGAALYPIYSDMVNENKAKSPQQKTVAILVFPGVELIDFTGPWEVFGATDMKVFSVAKTDTAFACSPGLNIKPDFSFSNCPQPDILLIPGGGVDTGDSVTVNWIKLISQKTEHTVSVCTGAYYLGASGLLNNLKATTFYPAIADFSKKYPLVNTIDSMRFVDNGHIITSAGLTSGIDAAFHIVSIYKGEAETQRLANLLEYNWSIKSKYVRGKLADKYLTGVHNLFTPFEHTLKRYEGNEREWLIDIDLKTALTQSEIEELVNLQATQMEKWNTTNKKNQWTVTDKGAKCFFSISINKRSENEYSVLIKAKK